jgi:glutamyl-tRNA reductase
MHQIGVVGLSYRHAGVDEVARLSIPKTDLPLRLPLLREALGVAELLYVGTCNRVELLFATADGAVAEDLRPQALEQLSGKTSPAEAAPRLLRAWAGESAIEHLLMLACGLDSAQAGEREIAAQLRDAWETARAAGTCGPMLDRLVGEALGMAGRMQRLQAGVRAPSLADLAAERVQRHLGDVLAPVALIGVSPMTRRCGLALHEAGLPLRVVNRTLASAQEFAETISGQALSLEAFRDQPPPSGAVILAAGGGEPILDEPVLRRLAQGARSLRIAAPLIIDFGVPPNVDPAAARRAGLARIGMEELVQAVQERRLTELMRLAPVRAAIDEQLTRLRTEMATRAIGPRLAELRAQFEQIAAEEAGRAMGTELHTLDAGQREAVLRLAERVAHSLAHLPIAGLRAAAAQSSPEALDAFFREARPHRRGHLTHPEPPTPSP